ncbi:MAG TPA: hypothetical protein VK194_11055 [Candidatus Deferrimicrobium sp.]|nr:hypothetical protein [Candidatus Deferrimicrobium sp.]
MESHAEYQLFLAHERRRLDFKRAAEERLAARPGPPVRRSPGRLIGRFVGRLAGDRRRLDQLASGRSAC